MSEGGPASSDSPIDTSDFDADYIAWRAEQLAQYDRDYAAWRACQSRQHDERYRAWRAGSSAEGAPWKPRR
jgi:hypothetical protein